MNDLLTALAVVAGLLAFILVWRFWLRFWLRSWLLAVIFYVVGVVLVLAVLRDGPRIAELAREFQARQEKMLRILMGRETDNDD